MIYFHFTTTDRKSRVLSEGLHPSFARGPAKRVWLAKRPQLRRLYEHLLSAKHITPMDWVLFRIVTTDNGILKHGNGYFVCSRPIQPREITVVKLDSWTPPATFSPLPMVRR